MIVPITAHNTQTEQVPVWNCPYSVKINSELWRCFDEEGYKQYQSLEWERDRIQEMKIEQSDIWEFSWIVLIVWIILFIIAWIKSNDFALAMIIFFIYAVFFIFVILFWLAFILW